MGLLSLLLEGVPSKATPVIGFMISQAGMVTSTETLAAADQAASQ